jgi:hypothetical protein
VAVGRLRAGGPDDLVVADSGDRVTPGNSISVLLGNGDGTFGSRVDYVVGQYLLGVTVADFSGDGIPDLAVANSNNGTVTVLLGNGDGTFHAGPQFGVGRGANALVVGDFDRDERPDLAVANTDSNNVSVLLNDGNWPAQAGAGLSSSPAHQRVRSVTGQASISTLSVASSGVAITSPPQQSVAKTDRPPTETVDTARVDQVFGAGTGEDRHQAWALARPRAGRLADDGEDLWGGITGWRG